MMRMRRNFLTSLDKLKVRYNEFMNRVSRWGAVAVAVYFALVGLLFYSATDCYGLFCGAVIIVVILPWSIIFENGIHLQFGGINIESDSMIWFWTAAVLNVLILYFIFAAIQKWMKKY